MNWTRENVPPSTPAVVLIVSVFARPGNTLDQEVPLREQADEHPLEHRVLPGDDAPDLEERLLEAVLRLGRCDSGFGRLLAHALLPSRGFGAPYVSTLDVEIVLCAAVLHEREPLPRIPTPHSTPRPRSRRGFRGLRASGNPLPRISALALTNSRPPRSLAVDAVDRHVDDEAFGYLPQRERLTWPDVELG